MEEGDGQGRGMEEREATRRPPPSMAAKKREMEIEMATEKNVERLLNRISLVFAAVATLALLHLFSNSSLSCTPAPVVRIDRHVARRHQQDGDSSPRSSCDVAAREVVTPEKRFVKLRSSRAWRRRADAFAALFATLRSARILYNSTNVLCVSAGAGHEVAALQESGVADVTGVDIIDFFPLVRRADPHNLPFFDNVFDLGFSTGVTEALFPARFVSEMERTVRRGGAIVLAVNLPSSAQEVEEIKAMFKKSILLEVRNMTMLGSDMTLIVMKNNGKKAS
ncbi:uncharacterized protein LOC121982516 [Zingiber officinale]|uniref:Methyltransferase type 11 domain-containing protein n=1 Tax=Zingiber officinale TaxID=94328 RepID=A0A8J5GM17_ZINOF|nr:uncharacterized protein LOC121982516 [Zingiber officinale]KAG6509251.1 hypothetical protein ZIOFF_034644 [Zingiber officinale]